MPRGNNFEHAPYSRSDPRERVGYRDIQPSAPYDSEAWTAAMASYGTTLSRAGVKAIVFLHGLWMGTDLFGMERLDEVGGLKRGYSRGIPGMEALLALMRQDTNGLGSLPDLPPLPLANDEKTKKWMDHHLQDAGNFSESYVGSVQKAINRDLASPLHCIRYLWSSEHHHLGRAAAACSLLAFLRSLCTTLKLTSPDRILIQAHGHAGQVLALMSNLIAPVESFGRHQIFKILTACNDPVHESIELFREFPQAESFEQLLEAGTLLNGAELDVVTYGTPVRYGWDTTGLGKLLHVVNHRMMRGDGKRWLAKMELPQITMEMPIAWGGDYVQQLAVAGCDAVPPSPEAQAANKAIWELVEPWDGFERWLECARKSVRCAKDGKCVLVDYKDSTGSTNGREHVYGHAAYTRTGHVMFNTATILEFLYS